MTSMGALPQRARVHIARTEPAPGVKHKDRVDEEALHAAGSCLLRPQPPTGSQHRRGGLSLSDGPPRCRRNARRSTPRSSCLRRGAPPGPGGVKGLGALGLGELGHGAAGAGRVLGSRSRRRLSSPASRRGAAQRRDKRASHVTVELCACVPWIRAGGGGLFLQRDVRSGQRTAVGIGCLHVLHEPVQHGQVGG